MRAALQLKIRYGLRDDPSAERVALWAADTAARIANGEDPDGAGRAAAFSHLEGVETRIYLSEADNVEALLKALAQK